jgi:DNA-binding PadR family transcriptional regulator
VAERASRAEQFNWDAPWEAAQEGGRRAPRTYPIIRYVLLRAEPRGLSGYEIYREVRRIYEEHLPALKPPSYETVRQGLYVLRRLGLVELAATEPPSNPHSPLPRHVYRLSELGRSTDPQILAIWLNPKDYYTEHPESRRGPPQPPQPPPPSPPPRQPPRQPGPREERGRPRRRRAAAAAPPQQPPPAPREVDVVASVAEELAEAMLGRLAAERRPSSLVPTEEELSSAAGRLPPRSGAEAVARAYLLAARRLASSGARPGLLVAALSRYYSRHVGTRAGRVAPPDEVLDRFALLAWEDEEVRGWLARHLAERLGLDASRLLESKVDFVGELKGAVLSTL